MPKFALNFPFFIIMICLLVSLVGVVTIVRMPVDLFPRIDMPVVVVATFYNGMPPEQIEADITNTFERFFTLAANVDHSESRSLTGVSLIKIYFKPGTDPNAALSNVSNLAMADLRRLPPGTLPPVVLGMDASTQPVCLVTLKGEGLNEVQLKDLAQFQVRNQISNVQGASVPQPYGGTYRQIQIYVDPLRLEARNMSLNDVVTSVNNSNLILPAGDVRIGSKDFNIYANSQFPDAQAMNSMPLKTYGNSSVLVADVGKAMDSGALQYNIVRIDGQRSVYVPIFKQGGNSNTITIVDGIKGAVKKLVDIPESLKTDVVFDQSVFVKLAISNVVREAGIGLVLTGVMILIFLGSPRATVAVLLAVPLSMIVCLMITNYMGGSINTMVLGGLALVFSRLIDNGVIVLENIFRHMEEGEAAYVASERGGQEVSMAVLAATFTTSIVFFPVTFFTGVSRYIFTPLAMGVVLSIFASYFFAMTVVPLYCAKFINVHDVEGKRKEKRGLFSRFERGFNARFQAMLDWYERLAFRAMQRPVFTAGAILLGVAVLLLVEFPFLGRAYFPRTDPGQFVINVRMPAGTRLEVSNDYISKVENIIRSVVKPSDIDMVVSNIGVYPDLSAIYTTNASMDTAFIQTSLKEGSSIGSYEYMQRVQRQVSRQMPELSAYYQAGGLVDAVINQGLPAPIDIEIKSQNMDASFELATQLAAKIRNLPNVANVYIPQSIDYPGLQLNIDRQRASLVGLTAKDVVDDVITALTSSGMVAPSYWIDPNSGNNYLVTVQYANRWINNMSMEDLKNIPLRGTRPPGFGPMDEAREAGPVPAALVRPDGSQGYVTLGSIAELRQINTPTEVDHNQIRRVIDVYVATRTEALQSIGKQIDSLVAQTKHDRNTVIDVRGAVVSMNTAFHDFSVGLIIAVLLVYLILMAQFTSFIDPFIILMAIPPGLLGVVVVLILTGSTLNIMSLMGVIMMTGIVVSNSILIVEFSNVLHRQGLPLLQATVQACKVRLRPILMTSLATLLGMIPMALGLEAGSEQYAPLARAIIGGLALSVVVTMFLVPAVYLAIHERQEREQKSAEGMA
jgi:multidrug efflux pump subunit AcrB